MKKKLLLSLLIVFSILLSNQSLLAQNGCSSGCNPTIEQKCVPLNFVDLQNPRNENPCDILICIEQNFVCNGEICQSFAPICSQIKHSHTGPISNLCFLNEPLITGGPCEGCHLQTTSITISRVNGSNTNASIVVTNPTQIQNFMNVVQGLGGGFSAQGLMTDCDGNIVPTSFTMFAQPSGLICSVQ